MEAEEDAAMMRMRRMMIGLARTWGVVGGMADGEEGLV